MRVVGQAWRRQNEAQPCFFQRLYIMTPSDTPKLLDYVFISTIAHVHERDVFREYIVMVMPICRLVAAWMVHMRLVHLPVTVLTAGCDAHLHHAGAIAVMLCRCSVYFNRLTNRLLTMQD